MQVNRNDQGITLIEVLLAIVLTAGITLALVRISDSAFGTLSRAADLAVAQSQTVTLYQNLRQDFNAATDAVFYGATYPTAATGTANLCTTATSAKWVSTGNDFTRTLLSMPVQLITYDPSVQGSNTWITPTPAYRGYEVRYNPANQYYQLWQVTCSVDANGAPLAPSQAKMMEDIGPTFDKTAGGATLFSCDGSPCTAEATTTTVAIYRFTLPVTALLGRFSKKAFSVSSLTDMQTLTNIPLTRMVSN